MELDDIPTLDLDRPAAQFGGADPSCVSTGGNYHPSRIEKGEARGGRYYRRTPKAGGGYRYFYTKEEYDHAHGGEAHVSGADTARDRERAKSGEVKLSKKDLLHRLKHGTYSIVSAGRNPAHADEEALHPDHDKFKARHEELRSELQKRGMKYTEVEGHYGGKEKSFLVYHHDDAAKPKRNAAHDRAMMVHHDGPSEFSAIRDLGKKFNQDSVIHSHGGKHEMHYTVGPHAGEHHKGEGHKVLPHAKDFYTNAPTKRGATKFSLNFDFDQYHPKESAMHKALRFVVAREQSVPWSMLRKAGQGEGSRGGHVIGHTSSGKPIYSDSHKHPSFKEFTAQDHDDASAAHGRAGREANKAALEEMDRKKQKVHDRQRDAHQSAALKHTAARIELNERAESAGGTSGGDDARLTAASKANEHSRAIESKGFGTEEEHHAAARAHNAAAQMHEDQGYKSQAAFHRSQATMHYQAAATKKSFAHAGAHGEETDMEEMMESTPHLRRQIRMVMEQEDPMAKGLYAFEPSYGKEKVAKIPDSYLPAYIDAFIEEAFECEKREREHDTNAAISGISQPFAGGGANGGIGGDPADWWAQWVMNALITYCGKNENLMRGCEKVNATKEFVAGRLRAMGLVKPAFNGGEIQGDFMEGYQYSEEQTAAGIGKSLAHPSMVVSGEEMSKALDRTLSVEAPVEANVKLDDDGINPVEMLAHQHRVRFGLMQDVFGLDLGIDTKAQR